MTEYVAEVSPVREVSLLGTADLAYWTDRLAPYGLHPATRADRAVIHIGVTAARFRGIRFREFIIGVATRDAPGTETHDGVFLVQAFSSLRSFAFIERVFFHTPYSAGKIMFCTEVPVSLTLHSPRGALLCTALMRGDERALLRTAHEHWEGPVYLSGKPGQAKPVSRVFLAKLCGATSTFAYDIAKDSVSFSPSDALPVFQELIESGFQGAEWSVRTNATHARSKTQVRDDV